MQLGYLGFEVSDLARVGGVRHRVLGARRVAARGRRGLRAAHGRPRAALLRRRRARPTISRRSAGRSRADEASTRGGERLARRDVDVTPGTAEEAARRRVARLVKLRDPGGIPSELFYGPALGAAAVSFAASCARASSPTTSGSATSSSARDIARREQDVLPRRARVSPQRSHHRRRPRLQGRTSPSSTPIARHHTLAFGDAAEEAHPSLHDRGALDGRRGPRLRPRAPRRRAHHADARPPPQRPDVLVLRRRRPAFSSSSAGAGARSTTRRGSRRRTITSASGGITRRSSSRRKPAERRTATMKREGSARRQVRGRRRRAARPLPRGAATARRVALPPRQRPGRQRLQQLPTQLSRTSPSGDSAR